MRVFSSDACQLPQSNQLYGLSASVEYALLLPSCVRIHSSPPSSIGVPCEIIIATNASRMSCRFIGSLAAPQSRERLFCSPESTSHHADSGSSQQTGLSGEQLFRRCG